jgi:hypothetical protein
MRMLRGITTLMLTGALLAATVAQARAQVKPGDVITPDNAYKVKNLVSPGVMHFIMHGMQLKIVPTERIDWPPPYKDATEKYSAQVRLSQDRRSMIGYVAGQPFPLLDPNDPDVATKIMWNDTFRPIGTDDYDLRYFDCKYQYENTSPSKIFYQQVGHYAGYADIGRTEVEPLPIDPEFKKTGVLYYFGLYPILAPMDQRGVGFIRLRYLAAARGDDIWNYQGHGTRRVRRVNEGIMSSAASEAEIFDPDHYSGFNAKNEEYYYKYIGEQNMLAVAHAVHSPAISCPFDGGSSVCPENWETRHMYVIEATPDRKRIQQALHSKTIVFVDSEMWFNPYVDIYDRAGRLWNSTIWYSTYRDRPVPEAKVAIYPFKREFIVAAARVDVQTNYSEVCYLPGQETPERECWYINMGAVDRAFFTVDAMVRASQD